MNYFDFNGRKSEDFKLYIKNAVDVHKAAEYDSESIELIGRDGTLTIDNNRFKDVLVTYECVIFADKNNDVKKLCRLIKSWLFSDIKKHVLYDSYNRDYFRYARCVNQLDVEDILNKIGKVPITFTCHPFKYSFLGQKKIELTSEVSLTNPESFPSKPYIKIVGNGDITLFINHKAFHFYGVSEYVEIDSELMECYKGELPQNNKMSGDGFPKLETSKNNISWEGAVTKLEIIPRWCCL